MLVRLNQSIWDDGADCYPPGFIAFKGELLEVHKEYIKHFKVAHPNKLNNFTFWIYRTECEIVI